MTRNEFVKNDTVRGKFNEINNMLVRRRTTQFKLTAGSYYDLFEEAEVNKLFAAFAGERSLIELCVPGLNRYSTAGAKKLNEFIRSTMDTCRWNGFENRDKHCLYQVLFAMGNLQADGTLYRGCDSTEGGSILKNIVNGTGAITVESKYTKRDFTSTTTNESKAKSFYKDVLLIITLKTGVLGFDMNSTDYATKYKSEDEIILMPNLKFKITGKEMVERKCHVSVECAPAG